jgi:hypothetical protein
VGFGFDEFFARWLDGLPVSGTGHSSWGAAGESGENQSWAGRIIHL